MRPLSSNRSIQKLPVGYNRQRLINPPRTPPPHTAGVLWDHIPDEPWSHLERGGRILAMSEAPFSSSYEAEVLRVALFHPAGKQGAAAPTVL